MKEEWWDVARNLALLLLPLLATLLWNQNTFDWDLSVQVWDKICPVLPYEADMKWFSSAHGWSLHLTKEHRCHDLAKWLSHYLYFFLFLFGLTIQGRSAGKCHMSMSHVTLTYWWHHMMKSHNRVWESSAQTI